MIVLNEWMNEWIQFKCSNQKEKLSFYLDSIVLEICFIHMLSLLLLNCQYDEERNKLFPIQLRQHIGDAPKKYGQITEWGMELRMFIFSIIILLCVWKINITKDAMCFCTTHCYTHFIYKMWRKILNFKIVEIPFS